MPRCTSSKPAPTGEISPAFALTRRAGCGVANGWIGGWTRLPGMDPSAGSRRQGLWWLLLIVVMAVVAAVAVVVIRTVAAPRGPGEPTPATTSPSAPQSPTQRSTPGDPQVVRPASGPVLDQVGTGSLVVQTATAIYWIDLSRGSVTRTRTQELTEHAAFLAGSNWVVFKPISGSNGAVVVNGERARSLAGMLREDGWVYLDDRDSMWFVPDEVPANRRVAVTRIDINGRRVGNDRILLPRGQDAASDLAGNLIVTNPGGFYEATPRGTHRLGTGLLVAASSRFAFSWVCDERSRCTAVRLNRSNGRSVELSKAGDSLLDLYQSGTLGGAEVGSNSLSPDGRIAALSLPYSQSRDGWPLVTMDLKTGRVTQLPGWLTDTNPTTQFAWSPNSRYLFAITDHRIRAVDVRSRAAQTLDLVPEPALHLTIAGQPSN